jgi:hypothetical protein
MGNSSGGLAGIHFNRTPLQATKGKKWLLPESGIRCGHALTPMNGISSLQKNFFEKRRFFSARH